MAAALDLGLSGIYAGIGISGNGIKIGTVDEDSTAQVSVSPHFWTTADRSYAPRTSLRSTASTCTVYSSTGSPT